jgi:hypothetical protein
MVPQDFTGRVFLDTCVVNFMLDSASQIYDNLTPPSEANARETEEINALRNIFLTGQRVG